MINNRKKIKRVPFELLDDFSIYCNMLRDKGLIQEKIGSILGKDRSTIVYHFLRYNDKKNVSKSFNKKIINFNESDFLKKYKKTGLLNSFFKGVNSIEIKDIKR